MDGLSIAVTDDEDAPSPVNASKTVRFQCGLLRETETFAEEDLEDVSLVALLEFVEEMLNMKVCCVRCVLCIHSAQSRVSPTV